AMNRDVMQSMLVTLGYPKVHIFHDSTDFLERMTQLSPSPTVILLDIHLSPHNGFELLTMLRAHEKFCHLPVIAVTASIRDARERLSAAGFDGCISKPISWRQFPQMIQQILNGEAVWDVRY
ncbi:MAG: response regulator, partial [Chloroflexi bacterium]|nr:response regulator [Chloroflexota bacterium]